MIIKAINNLPEDFAILEAESKSQGFRFLEKMKTEWNSGKNRFDKPSEALYGIFDGDKLVAIGGINLDPYTQDPSVGRLRHLYVLQKYRKTGLGAKLVKKILNEAADIFLKVRLRTDTVAASKFYENLGFNIINDDSASHEWVY